MRTDTQKIIFGTATLLLLFSISFVLLLLIPQSRESAKRNQRQNEFIIITRSLMSYKDTYGDFPPAIVYDSSGKPYYGWRVLITPFIEKTTFPELFNYSEPWDSQINRKLHEEFINDFLDWEFDATAVSHIYHSPFEAKDQSRYHASYFMLVDTNAPLVLLNKHGYHRDIPDAQMTPRLNDEIILVEVLNSGIHWLEPKELSIQEIPSLLDSEQDIPGSPKIGVSMTFYPSGDRILLNEQETKAKLRRLLKKHLDE